MKAHKNRQIFTRAFTAALLLGGGCQKASSAAPCGTAVVGDESGGSFASIGVGATSGSTSANAGGGNAGALASSAGAGGAVSSNGGSNLGSGGSGAAAATGGVVDLGGSGGAPDSSTCSALTLDTCASNVNCQGLSGQPITGEPLCLGAFQVIACGTKVGCDPSATRATDPQGHDWVFPSTCIPAGWMNSSQSGTRFDACMGGDAGPAN